MKTSKLVQEERVNKAFSDQSDNFDHITTNNPLEVHYREFSRTKVLRWMKPGEQLLELNCGTGLDAVFFAQHGLRVLATDNSDGMLKQSQKKINELKLEDKIQVLKCSFNDLSPLPNNLKYNHVFSNFGGLNCSQDLSIVICELDNRLQKGNMIHWIMIAPYCPWEWLSVLKGRFSYAFRRLKKNGLVSKIDGNIFHTYYYSSNYIKKHFGEKYQVVKLHSMGCLLPPTYKEQFPKKWPQLFAILKAIESRISSFWPFNQFGDLFLISLQKIKD